MGSLCFPSLLFSCCLSMMSGRSPPIRLVTFLSPVFGRLTSEKWSHLLKSSLVGTCPRATGRQSVVKTLVG